MQRHTTHVSTETTDLGRAQRGQSSIASTVPTTPARLHTRKPITFRVSDDPFVAAVREGVSQTRGACEGLSKKQHWFLDKLASAAYLRGLQQYVEIAQLHCQRPSDATALFDRLAALTLSAHVEGFTLAEAYGLETQANYELDVAQHGHALNPSVGTVDRVATKASAQEVASRVLAHTVVRQRPTLIGGR